MSIYNTDNKIGPVPLFCTCVHYRYGEDVSSQFILSVLSKNQPKPGTVVFKYHEFLSLVNLVNLVVVAGLLCLFRTSNQIKIIYFPQPIGYIFYKRVILIKNCNEGLADCVVIHCLVWFRFLTDEVRQCLYFTEELESILPLFVHLCEFFGRCI
jgi:hypothetical protein